MVILVLAANVPLPLTKAAMVSREHGFWGWKKWRRWGYGR